MYNAITLFRGPYWFLSNMSEYPVVYEGLLYRNSESAYQAAKFINPKTKALFLNLDGFEAKKLGKSRNFTMRKDWEEVKYDIMYKIVLAKFKQNVDALRRLIATGEKEIIEGNPSKYTPTKDDWIGKNTLGKIHMRIRKELSESGYLDRAIKIRYAENITEKLIKIIGLSYDELYPKIFGLLDGGVLYLENEVRGISIEIKDNADGDRKVVFIELSQLTGDKKVNKIKVTVGI